MKLHLECQIYYDDAVQIFVNGCEQPMRYDENQRRYICEYTSERDEDVTVAVKKTSLLQTNAWWMNCLNTIGDSVLVSKQNVNLVYIPALSFMVRRETAEADIHIELDDNTFSVKQTTAELFAVTALKEPDPLCLKRWKISNLITCHVIFLLLTAASLSLVCFHMPWTSAETYLVLLAGVFSLILDVSCSRRIQKKYQQLLKEFQDKA